MGERDKEFLKKDKIALQFIGFVVFLQA